MTILASSNLQRQCTITAKSKAELMKETRKKRKDAGLVQFKKEGITVEQKRQLEEFYLTIKKPPIC